MLTKYITSVRATFSPFNGRSGKTARNFLAFLPPNARSTMAIDINMLGRNAAEQPGSLTLKFSKSRMVPKCKFTGLY
jgi:large subunit ribosomal protein L53